MTEYELREFGRDCYAALGARIPEIGSPAWRIWAEMCADVPLQAAMWIRGKLLELDAMPRNFGKAVRSLASDWRSETGRRVSSPSGCHECDTRHPGFITAWRQNGARVILRCACNTDPYYDFMRPVTRAQAVRDGFILCPPEQDSFVRFERERFGDSPGYVRGTVSRLASRVAASPPRDEQPRPAHRAQMKYYDGAVPF